MKAAGVSIMKGEIFRTGWGGKGLKDSKDGTLFT